LAAGAVGLLAGSSLRWAAAEEAKKLPKALLLGDSVSIGYTNFVVGILLGQVDVSRPLNKNGGYENCEGTTKGVKRIDSWLAVGGWDVIHFNFGLHDLKHVDPKTGRNSRNPHDPQQATLEQYKTNLAMIVDKLIATKAKLIFATTTPFHENPNGPLRSADQPKEYNEVALAIMKSNGIMVNDLYSFVLPRINEFIPAHDVHPNEAASLKIAEQVVAHIRQALGLSSK
jgi:hypothetical protein